MKYKTTDLAVIIPTKDRPEYIRKHLQSLVDQRCELGQVIVVASGQDIVDIVFSFNNQLPIEYYRSDPGQVRQRNLGISKLSKKIKLVATVDDDIIFYKNAILEMINFWNVVKPETAGVGFNVITDSIIKHSWLRGLLGFSSKEPGRVLKSGFNTSVYNLNQDSPVEYIGGGYSVWHHNILKNYINLEINTRWAVYEDLIFSYPIGKKYPLYICSSARVTTDDIIVDRSEKEFYIYRGEAQYLWGLFFIMKNDNLSVFHFIINKLIYCSMKIFKGFIYFDSSGYFVALGMITAFLKSFRALTGHYNIDEYKNKFLNSLN